jgi:hypothetical protein
MAGEAESLANASGYCDGLIDVSAESVKDVLTPNGQFAFARHHKVFRNDPEGASTWYQGMTGSQIKVKGYLAQNIAKPAGYSKRPCAARLKRLLIEPYPAFDIAYV